MNVALFFMHGALGGGTTTFTAHLYRALELAGHTPHLFRVRQRSERFLRPFGKFDGTFYRNVSVADALKVVGEMPSLQTAPGNAKFFPFDPAAMSKLMSAGMRVVLHDPTEISIYEDAGVIGHSWRRPICIRPSMKQFFPEAKFIPHPYVRRWTELPDKTRLACSLSRVTFAKRTTIIVEANRLLLRDNKSIKILGGENRMYVHHKLRKEFPEYASSAGSPLTLHAGAELCANYKFMVDMSWLKEDGGGSQYTFMEAWDAGAVPVIHEDWCRIKGEMSPSNNCITVADAAGLAWAMKLEVVGKMVERGVLSLTEHEPVQVARAYIRELNR